MSKYTLEKVQKIIKLSGNTLISDKYTNNKTKLDILCYKCNNIYKMRLDMFVRGSRCRSCSYKKGGKKRRITKAKIISLLCQRDATFLKKYYKDDKLRIKYKCNKCSNSFDVLYHHYKAKRECNCVKKNRVINYDFVKKYVSDNGDILLSKEYVNAKTKLLIKCGECNGNVNMTWDSYQRGCRCRLCCGTNKLTYNEVKQYINNTHDKLISKEYKNNKAKMDIKCGKCNKIFKSCFSNFKGGSRCPKCSIKTTQNKTKLDYQYVKNFISNYGDELLSSTYINSSQKLCVKCNLCKNVYKITFTHFKRGVRCTCNNLSRGERFIKQYLDNNNILFKYQKKFTKCKNKRELSFDFYLQEHKLLIEFDGLQHFKPVEKFGGKKYFNETHTNDIIKNMYCTKYKKKLLRICYKDIKNINKIIDEYLTKNTNDIITYSYYNAYEDMMFDTNEELLIDMINSLKHHMYPI
jgi:very-short-patch-repair endonuclease